MIDGKMKVVVALQLIVFKYDFRLEMMFIEEIVLVDPFLSFWAFILKFQINLFMQSFPALDTNLSLSRCMIRQRS